MKERRAKGRENHTELKGKWERTEWYWPMRLMGTMSPGL